MSNRMQTAHAPRHLVAGRTRKTALIRMLVSLLALALVGGAFAAEELVVVVNHDNPVASISAADLKRLYTGKLVRLGDQKMVPVNQPLDSSAAAAFLDGFIGMTKTEYEQFWMQHQTHAGVIPPMIQRTAANVLLVVSQLPGGIAYMWTADADSTVKVVSITE
ncbi:MAG: hypothetical protein GF331_11000 [Chitinivibrionales bacterium]|nr:hypothetical protein [Chitinivibrionales bacterium]